MTAVANGLSAPPPTAVECARLLCQEARVVLTSLRGGPPHIARGELAQDLMELRDRIPLDLERNLQNNSLVAGGDNKDNHNGDNENDPTNQAEAADENDPQQLEASEPTPNAAQDGTALVFQASMDLSRPFLAVITDPRASGPHTAVALQSVRRLLRKCALPANEAVTRGILSCKFEQTNAGQDEAVEMAIADVLCLLLQLGIHHMDPRTVQEAFHTVYVTRNTFVHSPALCYHLEDVLVQMVQACHGNAKATRVILEFLLHELLQTPLSPVSLKMSGGGGSSNASGNATVEAVMLDESTRETQATHDATRVLCLRLVRLALESWPSLTNTDDDDMDDYDNNSNSMDHEKEALYQEELLPLVQDDLCLSLLMTGQAIWHYGSANGSSTHLVSPAVLTEICATIIFLWNCPSLRPHLMGPFEAIWTGFYTRSLALLRRRREAVNAAAYHANLVFDAELEIILESLTDLLHLHDHSQTIDADGGGALETMFAYYDCHLQRSDVAIGLYVELCRACGGLVNEEGMALVVSASSSAGNNGNHDGGGAGAPIMHQGSMSSLDDVDDLSAGGSSNGDPTTSLVQVDHPWRPVPAHLKELCAAAIMGGMKCLFRDDHASPQKVLERATRNRSILSSAKSGGGDLQAPSEMITTNHAMRAIKSQKRFMRKASRIFNQKASRGIEFLVDCGLLSEPVKPLQVATFMRHAIVVGLDKAAVGSYLGEAGKATTSSPSSGPAVWERDWFHKECLEAYCGLFSFQDQSLLDSLRMFLAAFRLPGEAQQIDRILQAFADKCAALCQEASTLFSKDPKKASDAAYLLSFSIIMLNTDQHNANIRADKKMTVDDFVRNNTDYGRDITEPGKELPREYLVAIYDSIREEEIRTEGEGADGAMTVERWKDVLRQAHAAAQSGADASEGPPSLLNVTFPPAGVDADDLTELVLEHSWKPILSAIGAFWNASGRFPLNIQNEETVGAMTPPPIPSGGAGNLASGSNQHEAMLGVQGARLGMDMSLEMLQGVRQLGRIDIFRKIYAWVCDYTGLLQSHIYASSTGNLSTSAVVANALLESVEAQSAVVVAIRTAADAGEDLNVDGWKRLWAILFELRDAHLLPSCLLRESEEDFLRPEQRKGWTLATLEGDLTDIVGDADEGLRGDGHTKRKGQTANKPTSMLGAFGRALFGSDTPAPRHRNVARTGKEGALIWDELAPSDGDHEEEEKKSSEGGSLEAEFGEDIEHLSPGAVFEAQLIRETMDINQHMETPVTGLERAEETQYQLSPRTRLRNRFEQSCQLEGLVSDSRFLDDESIKQSVTALLELIPSGGQQQVPVGGQPTEIDPSKFSIPSSNKGMGERSVSDVSISTPSFAASNNWNIPVSPASEAFAEVLICEIALKNRDRLKMLWSELLQDHYGGRLSRIIQERPVEEKSDVIPPDPGLEKRITGLLRLSVCSTLRGDVANDIISSWKEILPVSREQQAQSPFKAFQRHISEGLWRIVSHVDGLLSLNEAGWDGLMALFSWCATRSCSLPPVTAQSSPLAEDDPAVQTYRSLHLLLNSADLENVPCSIVDGLRTMVAAGDSREYPQLSVASLDLLQLLNQKKIVVLSGGSAEKSEIFCSLCWKRIVEAMAEAAEHPRFSNVRQHALSVLTDLFLDRANSLVPIPYLCTALSETCVPLAGRCIISMQMGKGLMPSTDELMIEFELCIGLIFKPLRHHLKNALVDHSASHVIPLWKAILSVLEELLSSNDQQADKAAVPETLQTTMRDLATEHLQNAVIMLASAGFLSKSADGISAETKEALTRMRISQESLDSWLEKGAELPS